MKESLLKLVRDTHFICVSKGTYADNDTAEVSILAKIGAVSKDPPPEYGTCICIYCRIYLLLLYRNN